MSRDAVNGPEPVDRYRSAQRRCVGCGTVTQWVTGADVLTPVDPAAMLAVAARALVAAAEADPTGRVGSVVVRAAADIADARSAIADGAR